MTRCSAHYRQIDVSRFVSRRSKTFFFSFFFAILSKKIWNEEYKPENKNTPLQLEKNFPKIWSTKLSSFFFVIRLIKKKNRQIDHTIHKKSSSRKKLRHKIPSIPSLPKKKTIEPISQTRFSIPLKKKKKKKKERKKEIQRHRFSSGSEISYSLAIPQYLKYTIRYSKTRFRPIKLFIETDSRAPPSTHTRILQHSRDTCTDRKQHRPVPTRDQDILHREKRVMMRHEGNWILEVPSFTCVRIKAHIMPSCSSC